MSSNIKLLPCPFCGGEAILDREDIFCDYCHLSMKIDDRLYNREAENYEEARTQAIEDWNTRKPMEHYKLGNCTNDCEHFDNAVTYGYTKAIQNFVDRLSKYLDVENATKYGNENAEQQIKSYSTLMKYEIADAIDDVAEQLKEGSADNE